MQAMAGKHFEVGPCEYFYLPVLREKRVWISLMSSEEATELESKS
jgi:hypothetical protein